MENDQLVNVVEESTKEAVENAGAVVEQSAKTNTGMNPGLKTGLIAGVSFVGGILAYWAGTKLGKFVNARKAAKAAKKAEENTNQTADESK